MAAKTHQLSLFEQKPERLMSPRELFEHASYALLERISEDNRVERKPAGFGGDKLGEYLSMWANTSPDGGLLVLGIRDDGAIEGCSSLTDEQLNRIDRCAYTFCPDAKTETKRVAIPRADEFVILVHVAYNAKVVVKTTKGEAFVRKGDSKCKLSADEVRELQDDKGQISFEQSDSPLSFPGDFDDALLAEYIRNVRKQRNIPEARTIPEVLAIRHLGRIQDGQFIPNTACSLLFAKDPLGIVPGCRVRFQRFDGEAERTGDKYNAVKDIIIEGPIPILAKQLEGVLDSQLRTFSPLDASGKFFPVPEYPKDAWYEALVNAVVHRSYGNGLKNMPVFVKMFDDRLAIESPGPFPPFVTPENIYDMHQPRNPHLMDAMFYLEYVRCAHEGTRRIRDTMANLSLPQPEFKQSEVGHSVVRVTLRNNIKQRRAWIDQDVSHLISEALAADFTEQEKRAMNWAAVNEAMTISDANQLLEINWHQARMILLKLARKRVFQYIRFREFEKDNRDPKAFFRLRSNAPIPEGGVVYEVTDEDIENAKRKG